MSDTRIALPRLMAHRGLSAHAPENTLASVRAAHEAGCSWVELDVQLLGDGTAVIWHDETVSRCSDGRGKLADLDYPRARRLDAGSWFSDDFRGEPMATLREMLELIDNLKMGLNLELKLKHGRSVAALIDMVVPSLLDTMPAERLILSSFNDDALARTREIVPASQLALGVLFDGLNDGWRSRCDAIEAYSVHADWKRLNRRQAIAVVEAGYHLICYTANDPTAFAHQWSWGVECVISDDPALFTQYLPEGKPVAPQSP